MHVNRSMAQGDLQVAEGTTKGYTVGTILSSVAFVLCNVKVKCKNRFLANRYKVNSSKFCNATSETYLKRFQKNRNSPQ